MSYAGRTSNGNGEWRADSTILPTLANPGSRPTRTNGAREVEHFPIIVHSHLCWDWVWQRPQQFLSRLSKRHLVLFIETVGPDPQLVNATARLFSPASSTNVTGLRLQFPSWRWSDGAFVDCERRRLVLEALHGPLAGLFEHPVQWFYDPMAVTSFVGHLNESAVVYDCMDELAQFRFAPPELRVREQELLRRADVVFTGGRRLFESKRQHNPNCHFYGCGVDVDHFGKARLDETRLPAELAALPKPVLGYFGVIDERIDYDLVDQLACANPDWSVAMVGPFMKVDEARVPRHPNLHWLGRREYAELPACAKGFDVCLMPFALNEATEFINPTKTLEYMATGRPIVSTAVPDVLANFGSLVRVARNSAEFIEFCRDASASPDPERVQRGLDLASANTWDRIVNELEEHVLTALRAKATRGTANQFIGANAHGMF